MNRSKMLWQLYLTFMRIGGLTFGGGLTMLPMLKYELVEKKQWIEEEDLLDCYAIGQCTPGIIAVNTATFVGYKKEGVLGGICSTLGMVTPSLVIITLIASFLHNFMDNAILMHAMIGVRGVVCALMLNTVLNLGKKSLVCRSAWIICIAIFLLAQFVHLPTIVLVLISAAVGILLDIRDRKAGTKV